MICEYGCGKEATHQFKNKKWCCSKNVSQCHHIKKQIGNFAKTRIGKKNPFYGKRHSATVKDKMSLDKTGENNPRYGCMLNDRTKQKLSNSLKGRLVWNKGKTNVYSKEVKLQIKKSNRENFSLEYYQIKYPTFYKIEELRINKKYDLQAKCKKCKKWFKPDASSLAHRINAIEKPNGNGGNYLYCSKKCKRKCSLYGKRVSQLIKEDQIKAGYKKEEYYTSFEYEIFRREVLKRSNYKCQYCSSLANYIHHEKSQKLEPFFSLDPDLGWALCKKCHEFFHRKESDCSYGKLANIICK